MNDFILKMTQDFELFKFDRDQYKKKLNELARKLNLKNEFNSDVPPTYFAGNILSSNKIVFIGINPGAKKENLEFESKIRSKDWNSYWNFHINFFSEYKKSKLPIRYYAYLRSCFDTDKNRDTHYFDYCDRDIVNIDLVPYHSSAFNFEINDENKEYIIGYFNTILEYLKSKRDLVKYVAIHKKQLVSLLLREKYFDESNRLPLQFNSKRKVYLKKIDGFNFLFFSRFIPNGGFSRDDIQKVLNFINL